MANAGSFSRGRVEFGVVVLRNVAGGSLHGLIMCWVLDRQLIWNVTNFRWTVPYNPVGQPPFIKFDVTTDDRVTGLYFVSGSEVRLMTRKATAPAGRVTGEHHQ